MKMSVDQALRRARSLSPQEAEALYREMLARFPANRRLREELDQLSRPAIANAPPADLEAVLALYRRGEGQLAAALSGELLARSPNCEILNNIAGAILAALGRAEEAIGRYDHAIALAPDFFEAHNNRGIALNDLGRAEEALASFDTAIRLHGDNPEAYLNRGIALRRLRRLDEALASGNRAVKLRADCAEAHNVRGTVLLDLGRPQDALAAFDAAIAFKPTLSEALVNRANALAALNHIEEALAGYDRALALAPGQINALNNRGSLLRRLKRFDEALASHRRAFDLAPLSALADAEIRNLEAHMCIWPDPAAAPAPIRLGTGADAIQPFYMLNFEDSLERQLDCARRWTAAKYGPGRTMERIRRAPGARIRIGYFSTDFRDHATMHCMAGLFERHDRSRFEVHVFSYGPDVRDAMQARLAQAVDAFHVVGHLSDEEIARLAREQAIEIAIDLKGHTQDARLGIFARRAAPVQVGLLGFPGTTGSDFIDHLIADRAMIADGQERFFSEQIAWMPHCYYPTDNRCAVSDRSFTRAELGLPEKGFVFCSFNNNYKITPAEFDIWMRLLSQVPGSVLWLLEDNRWAGENLRREAVARGIDPARLVFADRMPSPDHMARHRHADLFLDTFRVNAHTTASDALWMGVPVLTMPGESFAARVAGSMLETLGMPELIAADPAAYESRALEIATDPGELAALKAKLAERRLSSPLFDSVRYARDLEALYEQLLERDRPSGRPGDQKSGFS